MRQTEGGAEGGGALDEFATVHAEGGFS